MKILIEKNLGNCKFPDRCVCDLKNSFELISKEIFYVYDEGNDSKCPVRVVTIHQPHQLTVNNTNKRELHLIKTDKCLIIDEISKCDCIISSDTESFLVEIKSCSSGTRSKRRSKAVGQLKNTIDFLRLNQIEIAKHKITALICFKSNEPRITQASRNSASALFKEEYEVMLKEGNVIDF